MTTWREDIVEALQALGGAGAYEEIYAEVAARRLSLPPSWKEVIRRTIQQSSSDSAAFMARNGDVFYSVEGIGSGTWSLRGTPESTGVRDGIAENPEASQGYVADSIVRKAIEKHAVNAAVSHYSLRGAKEIEELGKPYDLRAVIGDQELHVEVKGSLRKLTSVTLTKNEVEHARKTPGTELFVVDEIQIEVTQSGAIETTGGRVRIWTNWIPSDASLVAKVFEHSLS